jgi:hypothetical protein
LINEVIYVEHRAAQFVAAQLHKNVIAPGLIEISASGASEN